MQGERDKALENVVALAAVNPLVPAALRVGLAVLVEELRELRARVTTLEKVKRDE
jgi:hypothetical protein